MIVKELLELAKYIIPMALALLGVYLLMTNFFQNEWKRRNADTRLTKENERQKVLLPIQLQAYERLILFLERINPNSSLHRLRQKGMSANDLQLALIANIRDEFEHNVVQQLYVSEDAWQLIRSVKEEMVKFYNLLGAQMPDGATELDYSRAIFDYLMNSTSDLPTATAIKYLKQDAGRLFE